MGIFCLAEDKGVIYESGRSAAEQHRLGYAGCFVRVKCGAAAPGTKSPRLSSPYRQLERSFRVVRISIHGFGVRIADGHGGMSLKSFESLSSAWIWQNRPLLGGPTEMSIPARTTPIFSMSLSMLRSACAVFNRRGRLFSSGVSSVNRLAKSKSVNTGT